MWRDQGKRGTMLVGGDRKRSRCRAMRRMNSRGGKVVEAGSGEEVRRRRGMSASSRIERVDVR